MSQHAGVPDWAMDGSFTQNNPEKHRMLIGRWSLPVTTAYERAQAIEYHKRAIITKTISHPCSGCGRFAFATADVWCFWCREGRA